MLESDTLLTFFSLSILLALAPGPDNLFVLTQSVQRGKAAGLVITSGLCSGLILHTTAVALGVAVIFQTSELAFTALKFVGAGYLLYLAWQAFHATTGNNGEVTGEGGEAWRLYRRGIIMNLTNPKVSIFFLAFLPQFADPQAGRMVFQLMLLGGLFMFATFLVFGGIAMLAGLVSEQFNRSARTQRILNWLAGTLFVLLAFNLILTHR